MKKRYCSRLLLSLATVLSFPVNAVECSTQHKENFVSLKTSMVNNAIDVDGSDIERLLKEFSACFPMEVHLALGELYYYGKLSERDIGKSIHSYKIAAQQGSSDAMNALGVIFTTEAGFINLNEGIELLVKAAQIGNSESKYNLFLQYKQGNYKNLKQALIWLQDVAEEGDEDAIILFAQQMHDITDATKQEGFVKKGLAYLNNKDFKRKKAAAEFVKAQIYGDEFLSLFDPQKRNIHLKNSADLGFERAVELWTEYERLGRAN